MAALSHSQAAQIIDRAWRRVHGRAPTRAERVYAQAVALLETGYGRAGQFGALADRGGFNWGALETRPSADGTCPPNTMPGTDQGAACFYVYASDELAAAAFLRTLTTRHWPVIRAMRGSPEDVARAMRVPPAYYAGASGTEEDRVTAYARAIRGAISRMGEAVPSGSDNAAPLLVFLAAAGLLTWGLSEISKKPIRRYAYRT